MSELSELLLSTPRFQVVRQTATTPSGGTKTREVIRHPGACVIVPLLADGGVCLIRNWRISVGQTLVELPAGTLEPPEPAETAARRELIEETGYRAATMELLHTFFVAPGILDEKMHLFLATGLHQGPAAREAGEEIENWLVAWDEAIALIFRGEIQDAKTIVGLLWVDRLRRAGQITPPHARAGT
jgi:ADP-ribose pyrophosphatase